MSSNLAIARRDYAELVAIFDAGEPALLEAVDWPALERWTPSYLLDRLGSSREVTVLVCPNDGASFLLGPRQQSIETTLGQLIARVFDRDRPHDHELHYMWGSGAGSWSALDEIGEDVAQPPRVGGRPFEDGASGVWIGEGRTRTRFHKDYSHSLLAVCKGHKKVRLHAPSPMIMALIRNFLKGPRKTREAREAARRQHEELLSTHLGEGPQSATVDVRAGDVIYIPPYWWHEVVNAEPTIALSLRYEMVAADFYRHPRTMRAAAWQRVATVGGRLMRRGAARAGARG